MVLEYLGAIVLISGVELIPCFRISWLWHFFDAVCLKLNYVRITVLTKSMRIRLELDRKSLSLIVEQRKLHVVIKYVRTISSAINQSSLGVVYILAALRQFWPIRLENLVIKGLSHGKFVQTKAVDK